MAAREANIDEITVEEDLFHAAVQCKENDESSLRVTLMNVKQEPVDVDMLTVPDPFVFVNSILPDSELEKDVDDTSLMSSGAAEQSTLTRDQNANRREYFKHRKHKKSKQSVSAKRPTEFLLSHQERSFKSLSFRESEKTELARAQRDLHRLKSKYSDRVRELRTLRGLNLRLQELLFLGDGDVNVIPNGPSLADTRQSTAPVQSQLTNFTAVSRASFNSTSIISSTPCIATVAPPPPVTLHSVGSTKEEVGAEDVIVPDLPDSSATSTEEIPSIDLRKIKVKKGVYGDSMFTKHLAVLMWGPEKLRSRSVKGRKCNSKKGSVAKSPLSPEKLSVVREHFVARMMSERPPPSLEEQRKRIASINGFISDKIITLNRVSI